MIQLLFFRQLFSVVYQIQQLRHLIDFQPDNVFLMKLWHPKQRGRILFNPLILIIIVVKAAERGNFPHDPPFLVCYVFAG